MKLIEKFTHAVGFTKNESRIVLFLTGTFLLGIILKLWNVSFRAQEEFDYSESDSIFAARSQLLHDDTTDKQNASTVESDASDVMSININSASKDELIQLPGIGEAMAERILQYRKEQGPFRTIEELQNVKGIGKTKFNRIAPYVKVK